MEHAGSVLYCSDTRVQGVSHSGILQSSRLLLIEQKTAYIESIYNQVWFSR